MLKYLTSHAPRAQQRQIDEKSLTVPELFAKLKINILEKAPTAREVYPPASSTPSSTYSAYGSLASSSSASSPSPSPTEKINIPKKASAAPEACPPVPFSTYSGNGSPTPSSASSPSPSPIKRPEPMPSPVESEDEGVCCFERLCSISPVASEAEDSEADVEEPRKTWAETAQVEEDGGQEANAAEGRQDVPIKEATVPETKIDFPDHLMGKWLPLRRGFDYHDRSRLNISPGFLLFFEKVEILKSLYLRTNYMGTLQDVALDGQWRSGERWRFSATRLVLDLSATESESSMHCIVFEMRDGYFKSLERDTLSRKETAYVRQPTATAAAKP